MPRVVNRAELEKLVELVREKRCIYDCTDPQHRDAILINNIWESIAEEMGCDNGASFWFSFSFPVLNCRLQL